MVDRLRLFRRPARDVDDGARFFDAKNDQLWLVYGGRRHHVVCGQVHASLFVPHVAITNAAPWLLAGIPEGPELMFGTSLVRCVNTVAVHLLAAHPRSAVLHPIPSRQIAERCGFDLALCRVLPARVFNKIAKGVAFV